MEHKPTKKKSPERRAAVEAQRKLERAQEALERWIHQRDQRALDLADAERLVGERIVEGVPEDVEVSRASTKEVLGAEADRISTLRTEAEAAEKAVEAATHRIDRAQRNVWMAEADELLSRAKKLRRKAERRKQETNRLLDELREHEGVDYVPSDSFPSLNPPMNAAGEVHYIPKTQALIQEAAALEAQAQSLQGQAANTPEARAEAAEQERKAREETLASINADNQRKREEGLAEKVRLVDAPIGAGPN